MIRYNTNSPEISGKSQYNVLTGFARFCLIFGLCHLSALALVALQIPAHRTPHISKILLYIPFALSFVISFYLMNLGISLLNQKTISSTTISNAKSFLRFYSMAFILFCTVVIVDSNKEKYLFLLATSLDAGLSIFALSCFVNCLDEYVECVNIQEMEVHSSQDPSAPHYTTLFSTYDPMYSYGKILVYYGITFCIYNVVSAFLFDYSNYYLLAFKLSLGFVFLCILGGYFLMHPSEFGRTLNVILHFLMCLCVSGQFVYLVTAYGQTPFVWNLVIYNDKFMGFFIFFPYVCWCYFVIRTLTSPVIKHVCLRQGYEIE